MTAWEERVDAAIQRTELTGVSRLRTVPLDMIAEALALEVGDYGSLSDAALDLCLAAVMRRNAFPVPVVLR